MSDWLEDETVWLGGMWDAKQKIRELEEKIAKMSVYIDFLEKELAKNA